MKWDQVGQVGHGISTALLDLCSYLFTANREIPEITMANAINGEVAESEGQENTVEMEEGNIPSSTLF